MKFESKCSGFHARKCVWCKCKFVVTLFMPQHVQLNWLVFEERYIITRPHANHAHHCPFATMTHTNTSHHKNSQLPQLSLSTCGMDRYCISLTCISGSWRLTFHTFKPWITSDMSDTTSNSLVYQVVVYYSEPLYWTFRLIETSPNLVPPEDAIGQHVIQSSQDPYLQNSVGSG